MNPQEPEPAYEENFNITYDVAAAWGQYESSRVLATFCPQVLDGTETQ